MPQPVKLPERAHRRSPRRRAGEPLADVFATALSDESRVRSCGGAAVGAACCRPSSSMRYVERRESFVM
ncbi:MAG: hypothetical protein ACK52I_31400 [Pseudomonadota bacterium]